MHQFHDIPANDALIAVYAAYYMGSKHNPVKDHLNAHFNLRAVNSFNMLAAMEMAFGREDSPWTVIDHLSDKRRDGQNKTEALHGAHFLALYHKETGRVMITMPGLESDDNKGDTLMDLAQMTVGGMKGQSQALYKYVKDVERNIAEGNFKGPDGNPLDISSGIVIGAHSMGCTAAQMMALDGYKTVLVEPRPVSQSLIDRIAGNYKSITGEKPNKAEVLESLDASAVNIRSTHSNIWNSIVLPWVKQHEHGQNFAYGREGDGLDIGLGGAHRVEMSVPSINGIREARAYEPDVSLKPVAGHQNLATDLIRSSSKPRVK